MLGQQWHSISKNALHGFNVALVPQQVWQLRNVGRNPSHAGQVLIACAR